MSKNNRTKNAMRNMIFGTLLKLYQLLVPFAMRTAMIYLLGVQYLGLNGLFTSILSVLNLAELGVGSAMVYSMYKPIAEDDEETICALMQMYKIYYRIIGVVIMGIGLALLPFIPKLINGDVPVGINIYTLYLMNLGATVLTYWLFAYKNCILTAHQRSDISSKIHLFTDTLMYLSQFAVLFLFRNYYLYVMMILLTRVISNITISRIADKLYPQFQAKGKLPKEKVNRINQRIRDLFTSKLGVVVNEQVDSIVVSASLGLTYLAIYQNYYYIVNAVISLSKTLFYSCLAGIGNSLITETKEKNYNDFIKLTFLVFWISGVCFSCFLCLYQPFMTLWMGKDLLVEFGIVICFSLYFVVYEIFLLINIYKDAAGIWHEDRFRPLIAAMVNLALNITTVKYIGLYGIVLSTVISLLFISIPWLIYSVFTSIFDLTLIKSYCVQLGKYCISTIFSAGITYSIVMLLPFNGILEIIIKAVFCCIIPNIIFLLLYWKTKEFRQCITLVNNVLHGRIKPLNNLAKSYGLK